jgi:hypothetical protein
MSGVIVAMVSGARGAAWAAGTATAAQAAAPVNTVATRQAQVVRLMANGLGPRNSRVTLGYPNEPLKIT